MMPAYTYQVALKTDNQWLRAYVCAEDKSGAVDQFIEDNPPLTYDALLRADRFEVECCS